MPFKNSDLFQENKAFQGKLDEKMKQIGLELSELQLQQFDYFFQKMVEVNKHMNLTAITEEEIGRAHV